MLLSPPDVSVGDDVGAVTEGAAVVGSVVVVVGSLAVTGVDGTGSDVEGVEVDVLGEGPEVVSPQPKAIVKTHHPRFRVRVIMTRVSWAARTEKSSCGQD